MYLQVLELSLLVIAVVALVLIVLFISRRQPPPPQDVVARYTPGEQEIIKQIGEIRERLEKIIPPYGKVGYIPSSLEELKDLLGFTYIKLGEKELGGRPPEVDRLEELETDFLQAKIGDFYVYVIKRDEKKLVAVGNQYLDYLTVRFLYEFLDYI